MKKSGRWLWIRALTVVLVLLLCAGTAWAAEGCLVFSPNDGGVRYDEDTQMYAIEKKDGDYTAAPNASAPSHTGGVFIQETGIKLRLQGVTLEAPSEQSVLDSTDFPNFDLYTVLQTKNLLSGALSAQQLALHGGGVLNLKGYDATNVEVLSINGGTVLADFEKLLPADSAVITGGSVRVSFRETGGAKLQPTNGVELVYLTVIELIDAGAGKRVSDTVVSEGDSGYDYENAETDDNSCLYFYLPKDAEITTIKLTNGDTYTGNAKTIAEDTLTPFPFKKNTSPPTPTFPFTVKQTVGTGDYINNANGVTITAGGTYEVSMTPGVTQTDKSIVVDAGISDVVTLKLNGVNVDASASNQAALHIRHAGSVVLRLIGESTLKSPLGCAGVHNHIASTRLTIDSDEELGTLNATGGDYAAGIGGNAGGGAVGNITIRGGYVKATGGQGAAGIGGGAKGFGNVTINGGVVVADGGLGADDIGSGFDGDAAEVTITGGSVFGSAPVKDRYPITVTLDKAGAGLAINAIALDTSRCGDFDYGLNDVQTIEGGKARFFLPYQCGFGSVTANDVIYKYRYDWLHIRKEENEWTGFPPQYDVSDEGVVTQNDYTSGLVLQPVGGGKFTVSMAKGVTETDAPITLQQPVTPGNYTVIFKDISADAAGRNLPAIRFDAMEAEKGATTARFEGTNVLKGVEILNKPSFDVRFEFDREGKIDFERFGITFAEKTKIAKAASALLQNLLPTASLEYGSGSGESSYHIVKRSETDCASTAENCHVTFEGLMPVCGELKLDKDSTMTVGKGSTLVILPGSKVTGAGRLEIMGTLIGQSDAPVYYQISAGAHGGRPVVLTGVVSGYAPSGAAVSAEVTDTADFIGWTMTPAVEGVDLTKPKIEFTVNAPCALLARYKTSATGVDFDKDEVKIEAGDTAQLRWTVRPEGALSDVTFASDKPEIAEVDGQGLVYGAAAGEAVVTVTTVEGSHQATCRVRVTEAGIRPLDVAKAAIARGDKLKLNPPAGYAGTWSVQDASVAEIVKGNAVKGVDFGETELTFTVTELTSKRPSLVRGKALAVGERASVPLAVRKPKELVKKISFSDKTLYLTPGYEMPLAVTFKPANAPDKEVLYTTGNPRVARAKGGMLTAMGLGKTQITATASSFVQKKLTVVVTDALRKLVPLEKKVVLEQGLYAQLTAMPLPLGLDVKITWTSAKEQIAQVSENGVVTALSPGKCKITAACGEKKAVITVVVKSASTHD